MATIAGCHSFYFLFDINKKRRNFAHSGTDLLTAMSITSIIRPFFMRRVRQIERFSDECHEIQLQQLTQLLDEAKNTEYGKKHDFARLQDINDFKRRCRWCATKTCAHT